jgi:uncharacterized protein (TIGR02266 family)
VQRAAIDHDVLAGLAEAIERCEVVDLDDARKLRLAPDPAPLEAERRVRPRCSLNEPVVVEVPSWSELATLYTKDISHGGMFIATKTPPDRNTPVTVRLRLPYGTGMLEFVGVVVHVVTAAQAEVHGWTAGFGLQFTDLTPERRRALQLLVEQGSDRPTMRPVVRGRPRIRPVEAVPPSEALPAEALPAEALPSEALPAEALPAEPSAAEPSPVLATPSPDAREPISPRSVVHASSRTWSELATRSEQIAAQLKRRVPKDPASPGDDRRSLVDEALQLVAEKRYGAAIQRLELALQRSPSLRLRVLLCVVQARHALTERDFSLARARYEAVLELDPANALAQRELLMLSAVLSRPPV